MVLGFGSKKKKTTAEPLFIRASPSLPELAQQRIPWPEDFIDPSVVYEEVTTPQSNDGHGGPRKTSFHSARGAAIPFHKPFRTSTATQDRPGTALTNSPSPVPPSAYNGVGLRARAGSQRAGRRAKNLPTFNVLVVGAKHTGKSSLLRLILDTSVISPANSQDQLLSLTTFRASSARPTTAIKTACVEILQPPPGRMATMDDRVILTCIDTPGLDFTEGKEFALDRTVSGIVKYLDLQFAETLGEESKVVRTSKGDQHVHLCIYLIDPESVMTPAARSAKSRLSPSLSSVPGQPEASEYDSGSDDEPEPDATSTSGGHGELSDEDGGTLESVRAPLTPISAGDATPRTSVDPGPLKAARSALSKTQSDGAQNRLAMSPAEISVIARLAKRVNVLPVIARADTLTDGRLERVKRAIRRDLQSVRTGLDAENESLSIFAVWDAEPGTVFGRSGFEAENGGDGAAHESANGHGFRNGHGLEEAEEEEERVPRKVIRLRDRATPRLARSRSRKSLKAAVGAEHDAPDADAEVPPPPSSPPQQQQAGKAEPSASPSRRTSVASAAAGGGLPAACYNPVFARQELRRRIPFAIIAPERERDKDRSGASASAAAQGSQQGHGGGEMKGRFVRRFRWGTIDVLDPQHCDFAALRTAVLSSYLRALKTTTKDVLYERFRTEKLLARRATRNISDEDRKRMLHDLEL